jgi:thioredoxin 1
MMSPVIKQFSTEMGESVRVIKIDVDKNQSAASAFQIQGVPTFILFKKGNVLWRQSGVVPIHTLRQAVQNHL